MATTCTMLDGAALAGGLPRTTTSTAPFLSGMAAIPSTLTILAATELTACRASAE